MLLLTALRFVTSQSLADCLTAYARKVWKDGNIYCNFKRTSTSSSFKQKYTILQCYISFIQKKNTGFSGFFFYSDLIFQFSQIKVFNQSVDVQVILLQPPCRAWTPAALQ